MENVLANELNKSLIILIVGVIGLSALMGKLIAVISGSLKAFKKSIIVYLLASMLFFAGIAFTAQSSVFYQPMSFFIFLQVYYLLLGIAHFHLMRHFLPWTGEEKYFWQEFLFTVIIAMLGCICFAVIYYFFNVENSNAGILKLKGFEVIIAPGVFPFIIPVFLYQAFRKAVSIQPKIIRQWQYPIGEEIAEPEESKMKNLLVISFEFPKQKGDRNFTNFRAKAPTDMEFGQLFYYFINDYNERHPNSRIEFINSSGEPHEWIFYKKPRWYSIITRYLDTDKTIFTNNVRENDVIICSRSLN